MTSDPGSLEPDTKDWTWVLERACEECGFDAAAYDRHAIPRGFRNNAQVWFALLGDSAAGERARPDRWSTLEYACHVHDVHRIYHDRVTLMLTEDNPAFADWDQDATAVERQYWRADPHLVSREVTVAFEAAATAYALPSGPEWEWPARRSNGSLFTARTLALYFVHDIRHHLWDVTA